jgi:hypothetical protein
MTALALALRLFRELLAGPASAVESARRRGETARDPPGRMPAGAGGERAMDGCSKPAILGGAAALAAQMAALVAAARQLQGALPDGNAEYDRAYPVVLELEAAVVAAVERACAALGHVAAERDWEDLSYDADYSACEQHWLCPVCARRICC